MSFAASARPGRLARLTPIAAASAIATAVAEKKQMYAFALP